MSGFLIPGPTHAARSLATPWWTTPSLDEAVKMQATTLRLAALSATSKTAYYQRVYKAETVVFYAQNGLTSLPLQAIGVPQHVDL